MQTSKLNNFWHQLLFFFTTLWAAVNWKFMQLADIQILCGYTPGYQADSHSDNINFKLQYMYSCETVGKNVWMSIGRNYSIYTKIQC